MSERIDREIAYRVVHGVGSHFADQWARSWIEKGGNPPGGIWKLPNRVADAICVARTGPAPADDRAKLEAARVKVAEAQTLLNSLAYDFPGIETSYEHVVGYGLDVLESAEGHIADAISKIDSVGE